MTPTVKLPLITAIVRHTYAAFLIVTGIMTIELGRFGLPELVQDDPALHFLQAADKTGYLIIWVGIFKLLAGVLLLIPRTRPLAVAMLCAYTINILLWVICVARQWLLLGLADFAANAFLVWAYFEFFRPLFQPLRSTASDSRIDPLPK